ncbi:O-antigen ligase family protein [Facklamia sp. DSM 111018]|uniref:O-antigen ligase family protein n=1 Tax=Facklamia lactis TaxID=2749967 RepID=A0ABS0LRG8_9LACT|nr:O-antigen ligase family protein [Facklamia lactis]MBG9980893.1 O-antigen ligase family protein [Facklamia lactis]MBG9986744.1 O-antigen ligase family protein [Facklamia lactis]
MKRALNFFREDGDEMTLFSIISLSILLPVYICGPVTLIVMIILAYRHRSSLKEDVQELGWLSIFAFYTFVIAISFRNYMGAMIAIVIFLYALLFLYYKRYVTVRQYLLNLKIFVWGSIPLALLSYFKYTKDVLSQGYDLLYIFKYHNPQTRAEATLFNPNYYGLFIAMVIVIAIYLLYKYDSKRVKLLSLLAIFMNLLALILTGSRWSIPTVVVGMVTMVFFLKPKIAWILGFIMAMAIAMLVIKPDLLPRFTTLAYGFSDRFAIWEIGWKLFITSPIVGRGPFTFVNFYYLFADRGKMHAHQLLIDTMANYGLVGLIILIMAFTHYFRILSHHLLRQDIRPEIGLVVATFATVLFHGLMDVGVFWVQMGYMFLAIVVITPNMLEEISKTTAK